MGKSAILERPTLITFLPLAASCSLGRSVLPFDVLVRLGIPALPYWVCRPQQYTIEFGADLHQLPYITHLALFWTSLHRVLLCTVTAGNILHQLVPLCLRGLPGFIP